MDDGTYVNTLIFYYYSRGLKQQDILLHLQDKHDIDISKRTLQRRLQELQLFRRKNFSDFNAVYNFIADELQKSGHLHGFKWMHLKAVLRGFVIPRRIVEEIMKEIDPIGIEHRRKNRLRRRVYYNHGPNYLWHCDGYDKLKRFGIAISGCIDGFSRLIIWLKAGFTNSDPLFIAGYYINKIQELGAIPLTVRSDLGNENVHVERIQRDLRYRYFQSSRPPFLLGRSTGNQRIESWWAILKKENAQYWIDLFQWLENEGYFTGTDVDQDLVRFFFLPLIQDELNEVVEVWNFHNIRRSKNAVSPSGKPFNLYHLPREYGGRDFLIPVPAEDIAEWKDTCSFHDSPCKNEDVYDICMEILHRQNITLTNNIQDLLDNYILVREELNRMMDDGCPAN